MYSRLRLLVFLHTASRSLAWQATRPAVGRPSSSAFRSIASHSPGYRAMSSRTLPAVPGLRSRSRENLGVLPLPNLRLGLSGMQANSGLESLRPLRPLRFWQVLGGQRTARGRPRVSRGGQRAIGGGQRTGRLRGREAGGQPRKARRDRRKNGARLRAARRRPRAERRPRMNRGCGEMVRLR